MTAKRLVDLIVHIIGKEAVTREAKIQLQTLMETIVSQPQTSPAGKTETQPLPTPKEEKNELDIKTGDVDVANAVAFRFPKEFNLEFEGQEEQRRIKIFPDGISETN